MFVEDAEFKRHRTKGGQRKVFLSPDSGRPRLLPLDTPRLASFLVIFLDLSSTCVTKPVSIASLLPWFLYDGIVIQAAPAAHITMLTFRSLPT